VPIMWRDQMSVGNDAIDQDHKYLICLINSVELALSHEDTVEHLPIFIGQLVDYTEEHFIREEEIQKKARYMDINEHRREHEDILVKLMDLKQLVATYIENKKQSRLGKEEESVMSEKIISLARHWVLDHVLKTDKSMEHYLRKFPPTFR